jgi:flagellar basal-body rod modification protein FlgD
VAINNINNNIGVTAPTQDGSTAAKSGTQGLGRDDFMKLLVAQLKNQDPDNPLDTKELVTQLSQLTSVEQLITVGDRVASLEKATNSMAANQSSSLIGRTIEARNDSVQLKDTGSVGTAVNLGSGADKVTVEVSNEAGRVVRTFELDKKTAGQQNISWDGMTDGKERAKPGQYQFTVKAEDKAGNPVQADMGITGVVNGVSYENGFPEVVVGTTRVPLSNVTSIRQ